MDAHPLPIMNTVHHWCNEQGFAIEPGNHPLELRVIPPLDMDYGDISLFRTNLFMTFGITLEDEWYRKFCIFCVPSMRGGPVRMKRRNQLAVNLSLYAEDRDLDLIKLFFSKPRCNDDQPSLLLKHASNFNSDVIRRLIEASASTVYYIDVDGTSNTRDVISILTSISFPHLCKVDSQNQSPVAFSREEADQIVEWILYDVPQIISFLRCVPIVDSYLFRSLKRNAQRHCIGWIGTSIIESNRFIYENLIVGICHPCILWARALIPVVIAALSSSCMRKWRVYAEPRILAAIQYSLDEDFGFHTYDAMVSNYLTMNGRDTVDFNERRVFWTNSFWYPARKELADLGGDFSIFVE
jgi:hypothetical protein